jgi:hypothetical protein
MGRNGYPTRNLTVALAVYIALLSLVLGGCKGKKVGDDGSIAAYRSNFDSPEELNNWKCYDKGKWEVRDGWLVCDSRETTDSRSILWLSRIVSDDVQIEFEAECLDKPGEINCFLNGDGQNYSGYEINIGGPDNRKVAVYKSMKDGDHRVRRRLARESFTLDKERVYAIKIKKYHGSFRVYVNEEAVIATSDEKQPISDSTHRYFGFSTMGNRVRFDNLRIERRY